MTEVGEGAYGVFDAKHVAVMVTSLYLEDPNKGIYAQKATIPFSAHAESVRFDSMPLSLWIPWYVTL